MISHALHVIDSLAQWRGIGVFSREMSEAPGTVLDDVTD